MELGTLDIALENFSATYDSLNLLLEAETPLYIEHPEHGEFSLLVRGVRLAPETAEPIARGRVYATDKSSPNFHDYLNNLATKKSVLIFELHYGELVSISFYELPANMVGEEV